MSAARLSSPITLAIALCAGTGCAAVDDDPAAPAAIERGYRLLAQLPLDGGGEVELGVLPSGGIVTMEDVPLGARSPIDYLAAQHATPLEVYLALAAPDAPVPPELTAAHRASRAALGLDDTPQHFDPNGVAAAEFDWYYAADCSEDGSWFDNTWQSWGWGWHWYWSTTAYGTDAPAVSTRNLQAHLCNNGGSTYKVMRVAESGASNLCGGGNWHYALVGDVAPQHRRQFRVTDAAATCTFEVEGENKIGYSGLPNWRLGVTKP